MEGTNDERERYGRGEGRMGEEQRKGGERKERAGEGRRTSERFPAPKLPLHHWFLSLVKIRRSHHPSKG